MREFLSITVLCAIILGSFVGASSYGPLAAKSDSILLSVSPGGGKSETVMRNGEMISQKIFDLDGRIESYVYWDNLHQIHNIQYDVRSGKELSHRVTK